MKFNRIKSFWHTIKTAFVSSCVRRRANKAIDKILDAQVIFAEIQGSYGDIEEIEFWCDKVESCMFIVDKVSEHVG